MFIFTFHFHCAFKLCSNAYVGNIPISFWDMLTHMLMCCLLSCLHIIVIMLMSHLRTLTNVFYTFKLHFTLYINPVVHPLQ